MIEIKDEIEIDKIKTEKKFVKGIEIEYLEFHMQGKVLALSIKDEIEGHPLLELHHNGLGVKAQIVVKITNPQTSIEKFK